MHGKFSKLYHISIKKLFYKLRFWLLKSLNCEFWSIKYLLVLDKICLDFLGPFPPLVCLLVALVGVIIIPLSESEDISEGGGGAGLGSDFFLLFWEAELLLAGGVFLVLLADFWFLAAVGVGFLIVTSSSLSDSLLADSDSVELSLAAAFEVFFLLFEAGAGGFFFAAAFKKIIYNKIK